MTDIAAITQFVFDHYPPMQDWGDEVLHNWLSWHMAQQTVCVVLNDEDEIKGIGIARPVMYALDGAHNGVPTYTIDPEGSTIFVDLVISTDLIATRILALKLRERFGERDYIAYLRRGKGPIRVRPYRKMRSALITMKEKEVHYG